MKEEFLQVYNEHIRRAGAQEFLEWLETTDFFEAPASTRFHLSEPGGLVEHSLHVCTRFCEECTAADMDISAESIAICGLLHDVCKANFYAVEMRNRKNRAGEWERYPFYVVNDQFPYGHGEKSVYLISEYMKLTREEAMAIRWHMGFTDNEFKAGGYSVSNAFNKCKAAVLLHIADLKATYLDES